MEGINLPAAALKQFLSAVWDLCMQIPVGKVATYGQIAALIPPPAGVPPEIYAAYRARWVGSAMSMCPPDVPWQRVVNSQGKISERRGAARQQELLEAEGVVFDARNRIDLKRFGWDFHAPGSLSDSPTLPGF